MQSDQSRAASIHLVGGRPCLDLANTVSWRPIPERRQEHLVKPEDALTWSVRAGVLDQDETDQLMSDLESHPRRARRLVEELIEVRRQIWAHLIDREQVDLESLAPLVTATLTHCTLESDGEDAARWTVPRLDEHTSARRIVLDLLDLLTHPVGRIGHCANPECRWAFVDTSRAKNRRWCRSEDCGNRHRVRQHHARQQSSRSA